MSTILTRLSRLEAMRPDSLTIICKMPAGEETVMTVDQCIATGADFLRVQSGNDLRDVGRLLDYMAGSACVIK